VVLPQPEGPSRQATYVEILHGREVAERFRDAVDDDLGHSKPRQVLVFSSEVETVRVKKIRRN
jgi:hypothetical protein